MTRRAVSEVLTRIDYEPVLVASGREGAFITGLQELQQHDLSREAERSLHASRTGELAQAYGFTRVQGPEKPFAYQDGVAIIPIHGSLINRYYGSWGYATGYNFIRGQFNAALDDDDVQLIVFDVNSLGGEAAGCFELSTEIRAARGRKRIMSVVDSNCCSAAYAIASAVDPGGFYVTPSGQAGSIGVIAMHVSMAKALENFGMEVTLIYAGDHKADGNPFEKLPDNVKASIKSTIDKLYDDFVGLVVLNRGMTDAEVRDTQARSYRADEAKSLKLIDAVATPTEAVASFLAETGSGDPGDADSEDIEMAVLSEQDQAAALQTARTEAATAERTRMSGILGHAEAKDRPALAQHLASQTDMSVDMAASILGKAAKETAPAPAQTTTGAASGANTAAPAPAASTVNPLETAMASTQNPNIGADTELSGGAAGAGGEAPKPGARGRAAMGLAGMAKAGGSSTVSK
jgi:signal peptide peptidase SppA